MAADIRRRAELDASAVRREAAEWASETRREAERHRARVLADLEHAAQAVDPAPEPAPPAQTGSEPVDPTPEVAPVVAGVAPEAPDVPDVPHAPEVAEPPPHPTPQGPVLDLRAAAEARRTPVEVPGPRPAAGGTYVVGHRPGPVETSLESKVHDVVRLAVRRTFNRQFP